MFLYLLFVILSAQVTFGRVSMPKCYSDSDCPKEHSCHENICKKCLRCDVLFRKGYSCITDFNNCGDCLEGYEEVLITDFSIAIKPCKILKNKTKSKKCINDNSCPQNNYCKEESCVKCFDCSIVNRLPSTENCARDLNGCGSCMIGFHEVAVTTELNSKPCEKNAFVLSEMSNSYKISFSNIAPIVFLISVFVGAILTLMFKKFKGSDLYKSTYHPSVCPSAPPLYTVDASQIIRKIERKDSPRTCIKIEKQQAKVFKQPDALYYYIGEETDEFNDVTSRNNNMTVPSSWTPASSENLEETDCSGRVLAHIYSELGVINSLVNPTTEQHNQIEFRENVSPNNNSVALDVAGASEVPEGNTERLNTLGLTQNSNQGEI